MDKVDISQIALSQGQENGLHGGLFITGLPRSGTTLLGKIISTLKGVEYAFEPPTLKLILNLLDVGSIDKATAIKIMRVYLFEDCFIESVHGRQLNLRPDDDSLSLNAKSWSDIVNRWTSISNNHDAIQYAKNNSLRLAIKLPNMMEAIPVICETVPQCKVITIIRDPRDVINSIIKKQWLTNAALGRTAWPYKVGANKSFAPHWVEDARFDQWQEWNLETRSCYMWNLYAAQLIPLVKHKEHRLNSDSQPDIHIIRYESLLQSPFETVTSLAKHCEREFSPLTHIRLGEIKSSNTKKYDQFESYKKAIDSQLLQQMAKLSQKLGYNYEV